MVLKAVHFIFVYVCRSFLQRLLIQSWLSLPNNTGNLHTCDFVMSKCLTLHCSVAFPSAFYLQPAESLRSQSIALLYRLLPLNMQVGNVTQFYLLLSDQRSYIGIMPHLDLRFMTMHALKNTQLLTPKQFIKLINNQQ